jgi:hypothetical protein
LVVQSLERRLEGIDLLDQLSHSLDLPLVAAAENLGQYIQHDSYALEVREEIAWGEPEIIAPICRISSLREGRGRLKRGYFTRLSAPWLIEAVRRLSKKSLSVSSVVHDFFW